MSKSFPLSTSVFVRNTATGAEYGFRLKPLPAGKFAKAPKVGVTVNGAEVSAPTTNSKGWTEPGATLHYLWLTAPDGAHGWITSDPEAPFAAGDSFEFVEGQTKRADPERKLLSGPEAPNARRLAGFTAAWAAKKAATPAATEPTEGSEPTEPPTEGSEPTEEQPKKKGKKK